MLFDAHTHVHFPAYGDERSAVIDRARALGINMITVGTSVETSKEAIDIAKRYPDMIWATVGFHPNHAVENWHKDEGESSADAPEKFDQQAILELARDEKVVAIGECGLDYYRNNDPETKLRQRQVFEKQVEIAKEINKPLMIHCRPTSGSDDAYEDLLKILAEMNIDIPVVLHFYAGGVEVTQKFIDAGYNFTFGGVITFASDYDESIKLIPLDRIMLETDAPYVAPASNRGKRNESSYIGEVAEKLASIKAISYNEVEKMTTENVKNVFKIEF